MKPRALISVSDKSHLDYLAKELIGLGFEIISTGGTSSYLTDHDISVTQVSSITQFPEIMNGRVKTLHPSIHGGILARKNHDESILKKHDINLIDLVIVNLYPFKQAIENPKCDYETTIENIDIGGPAMIRAAAKNHERVLIVVDPNDYQAALTELKDGDSNLSFRKIMAQKAFAHTADYDQMIASYLDRPSSEQSQAINEKMTFNLIQDITCSYGENPHQKGSFYTDARTSTHSIFSKGVLQGKPLSYNNIADSDAAIRCLAEFTKPTCVIIKHTNPCGVASDDKSQKAYELAFKADSASAFGSVIALNVPVDVATAKTILDTQFFEILIAPDFSKESLELLANKPNARLIKFGSLSSLKKPSLEIKATYDGFLIQTANDSKLQVSDLNVVTKSIPTNEEYRDLLFSWSVCKHVKSNAIVMATQERTTGIGAGQMSRIMSTKIASDQTTLLGNFRSSLVMASDAFFPFPDNVELAFKQGVKAIIQPGGSIKDKAVIEIADYLGIKMVFTGIRNFKH
jgi:phosphoribosylaminoimidazolecarboxamide formyltransferase/IMP cyclohydrolase